MSNSANMNVAERLAQKLKSSEIGALLDEDDVTTIAQDAIKKAFFEPRVDNSNYNRRELPPLVVELATASFKAALDEKAKVVVSELAAEPAFREALVAAAVASIPDLLMNYGRSLEASAIANSAQIAVSQVMELLRSRGVA